jgi:drug/metabolite transporter (DMT)-like permease
LVFAWLLLGEGLSVQKLIGAAVIVASCVLVAIGESGADPEIQTQSSTMVTV